MFFFFFLYQVNHSPSFHTDAKLDKDIKEALLYDSINLVNFGAVDKKKCIEEDRRKIKERLFQRQNKKETKYVLVLNLFNLTAVSNSEFQTYSNNKYLEYFLWNCYQVNATTSHGSLVNIGSGNGLVPSGNKPLPEPMLT